MKTLIVTLLFAATAYSQQGNTVLIRFPGVPTGDCSVIMVAVDDSNGDFYDCFLGNWFKVGPGGGGGGVNSVTGTLPISSSGGANPDISISQAGVAANGYLSSVDWNTFNNKQPALSTHAAVAKNFLTGFTAPNTFTAAQPACSDLSDGGTLCASSGPLAQTEAGAASNFLTSYSAVTGLFGKAQPACANLSDAGTGCSGNAYPGLVAHDLLSVSHGDTTPSAAVLGGVIYADANPKWVQLAGNTTATKQWLSQTGTGVVSAAPAWSDVKLDELSNPSGNKMFTMATKQLKFTWTAPITADGALELEVTGAFTGDMLHIHQHTGNPGAGTDLLHLEADDADVTPLRIISADTIGLTSDKPLEVTIATGTAPLVISSTTEVTNLHSATATALSADPSDCAADNFANAIAANGDLTCAKVTSAATTGTFPADAHNILSATHGDTTAAAVVRGDLMTGQGVSPKWTRLPVGGNGTCLTSDGTDASWGSCAAGGGTNVTVNGGAPLASADLNATTPAAPANTVNGSWQESAGSVSVNVPYPKLNWLQNPDGATSISLGSNTVSFSGTGNFSLTNPFKQGPDAASFTSFVQSITSTSSSYFGLLDSTAAFSSSLTAVNQSNAVVDELDGFDAVAESTNSSPSNGFTIGLSATGRNSGSGGLGGGGVFGIYALGKEVAGSATNPSLDIMGVYGLGSAAATAASGSITDIIGVQGAVSVQGGGTLLGGATALSASLITKGVGVTIPNAYGVFVSAVTAGTNNYSVYTNGSAPARFGGLVNAIGGLQYNGAATSGRYLKGDGTSFIQSSGSASGTGGCTNQFARTLNSDAAPTCATVAVADVVAALQTRSVTYIQGSDTAAAVIADADDQAGIWANDLGNTYRITRIWVQSDAGTPSINLQRDDGSAANILSSALSAATGNGACADSSGGSMTIRGGSITCSNTIQAAERDVAVGDVLNYLTVTAGGVAKRITVNIQLVAQ